VVRVGEEGSRGRPRRGFREEEVGVGRKVERREAGEKRRGGEEDEGA
jgi:hypothetical protein